MKAFAIAAFVAVTAGSLLSAADFPELPTPTKEHDWLQQFAGEWTSESEGRVAPDQPAFKCTGTESSRMIGGFFLQSESVSEIMGTEVKGTLTLGYDPQKKKYVGTWICSAGSDLWHYEGTVDPDGKKVVLDTEGPNMMDPTKRAKYKDTLELISKDHKRLSSSVQTENGEWITFMTIDYKRKK